MIHVVNYFETDHFAFLFLAPSVLNLKNILILAEEMAKLIRFTLTIPRHPAARLMFQRAILERIYGKSLDDENVQILNDLEAPTHHVITFDCPAHFPICRVMPTVRLVTAVKTKADEYATSLPSLMRFMGEKMIGRHTFAEAILLDNPHPWPVLNEDVFTSLLVDNKIASYHQINCGSYLVMPTNNGAPCYNNLYLVTEKPNVSNIAPWKGKTEVSIRPLNPETTFDAESGFGNALAWAPNPAKFSLLQRAFLFWRAKGNLFADILPSINI